MRYSILGFNQDRARKLSAVTINANGEEVVLTLDVTDLLLLNLLADFPNRASVKKYMKDDKVFFWASYEEVIDELPILNIKKQALAKRFEKLEKMHLIEREFLTQSKKNNLTYFSLTKIYESLLYEKGGLSRIEIGDPLVFEYDTLSYLNTGPSRIQIRDKDNNIKDNNKEDTIVGTNVPCEVETSRSNEGEINWDGFLKFFNDAMANKAIPQIKRISETRRRAIRARAREYGKAALSEMVKNAAASDFLNGRGNRGFVADFDWLFKPKIFPKVLEGNYNKRDIQQQNNNYGTNFAGNNTRTMQLQEQTIRAMQQIESEATADSGKDTLPF